MPLPDSRERDLLLSRLAGQRRHVLTQLEGLSDEQLRQPVLPSGWSCLGLVRHLTLSDERYWFEVVIAGGPLDFWPTGDNGDWQVASHESADEVLRAYRSAIAASDEIITSRRLDDAPAQPEDWWGEAGLDFSDLRSVLVHVLVETAVHAGHLDAARELLDGHQYLVLDVPREACEGPPHCVFRLRKSRTSEMDQATRANCGGRRCQFRMWRIRLDV